MNVLTRLFRRRRSFPGVTYKEREVTDGNEYEVYTAPTRALALDFLRAIEIRKERKYVIVEAPSATLGKDLIMIFGEKSSARIEYGVRIRGATEVINALHTVRIPGLAGWRGDSRSEAADSP